MVMMKAVCLDGMKVSYSAEMKVEMTVVYWAEMKAV